jgi:hypothetical protein
MVGDCSRADDCMIQEAGSRCVRAGKIINNALPIGPWQHCHSICRLPSSLYRQCGSSIAGTLADVNVRLISLPNVQYKILMLVVQGV